MLDFPWNIPALPYSNLAICLPLTLGEAGQLKEGNGLMSLVLLQVKAQCKKLLLNPSMNKLYCHK